jgi:hypothetical protein
MSGSSSSSAPRRRKGVCKVADPDMPFSAIPRSIGRILLRVSTNRPILRGFSEMHHLIGRNWCLKPCPLLRTQTPRGCPRPTPCTCPFYKRFRHGGMITRPASITGSRLRNRTSIPPVEFDLHRLRADPSKRAPICLFPCPCPGC